MHSDQHATADFETYSEAGYHWDDARQKWTSLPWYVNDKRGLEVVGVDNYVNHPTFRPTHLAYDFHDGTGEKQALFLDHSQRYDCPADLRAWVESGRKVESWNCGFEWFTWEWCVRNWGWPPLPLEQQLCAMAKSRAAAYPGGLDNAAAVLGTPRKDKIGGRLVGKLTVPRNPTKKDPARRWTMANARTDFLAFGEYNKQDVRSEYAASCALPAMTPYEFEVWQLDQRINRRGMAIDVRGVDDCIAVVEQATWRANEELRSLTLGAVKAYTEVANMLRWMAHRGVPLHELDEETVGAALKRSDLPPDVARVLRIRQALSFGSVKKLYALRAQVGADGRLRDQYTYHGAHTSLWNGRGAQPANFPRPMHDSFEKPANVEHALRIIAQRSIELLDYEYGPGSKFARENNMPGGLDPLEVVASCLRSLIVAPPGHRLISADFNSIQAVVTSALAGEQWRLEVFRTHGKIYETMGARLTGVSLEEVLEYKRRTGKHHSCRQNPGKLAVLSGDFGAWINGWKRFGADKLLGSDANIKAAIMKTRAAQPAIVELWGGQTRDRFQWNERPELYGLEGAVVSAIKEPGRAFEVTQLSGARTGIVYQMHGPDLLCKTPADWTNDDGTPRDDCMRYHNARLKPSTRPYAREWEYEVLYEGWNSNAQKGAQGWQTMTLYGGVLTQNTVSRVSRQVQARAMLRLQANGWPIVHHTHDENVCEVPIGSHHTTVEHTRLTAELPPWARSPDGTPWPIKVPDSWEQPRYGKW